MLKQKEISTGAKSGPDPGFVLGKCEGLGEKEKMMSIWISRTRN